MADLQESGWCVFGGAGAAVGVQLLWVAERTFRLHGPTGSWDKEIANSKELLSIVSIATRSRDVSYYTQTEHFVLKGVRLAP